MPQPMIMRAQPEEVVKTWRTNSALDGGTQLPRVSWSRAIAAPSQTKKPHDQAHDHGHEVVETLGQTVS